MFRFLWLRMKVWLRALRFFWRRDIPIHIEQRFGHDRRANLLRQLLLLRKDFTVH